MMSILMVRCKNCGSEFPSRIQMEKSSFATITLRGSAYKCPRWGTTATYDKEGRYFPQMPGPLALCGTQRSPPPKSRGAG